MTPDEVRQLAADLRVIARNDLTGGQRVCSKAAAILERLADDRIAKPVGPDINSQTMERFYIRNYRKRLMGED